MRKLAEEPARTRPTRVCHDTRTCQDLGCRSGETWYVKLCCLPCGRAVVSIVAPAIAEQASADIGMDRRREAVRVLNRRNDHTLTVRVERRRAVRPEEEGNNGMLHHFRMWAQSTCLIHNAHTTNTAVILSHPSMLDSNTWQLQVGARRHVVHWLCHTIGFEQDID